jgi:hypothetical protein
MKKVLPLRKTIDALGLRLRNAEIETIRLKVDRLLTDVQEASTVSNIAGETWGDGNEMYCGVLDLLNHKLGQIEQAAKSIAQLVGANGEKS